MMRRQPLIESEVHGQRCQTLLNRSYSSSTCFSVQPILIQWYLPLRIGQRNVVLFNHLRHDSHRVLREAFHDA